jgi:hypothetical protein
MIELWRWVMVASKQIDVSAANHADCDQGAVRDGGTDLSAEISCPTASPARAAAAPQRRVPSADARGRRQLAERACR